MRAARLKNLELHVTTTLHEYDSLRQESLNAIAARVQIVGFVFTGLALVIAGVTVSDRILPPVAVVILTLFVPTLAKLSIIGWLIEYRRSQRAGVGLAEIERSINLHIDRHSDAAPFRPAPLGWESGLIKRGNHTSTPYGMTLFLMYAMGLVGSFAGLSIFWRYLNDERSLFFPVLDISIAILVLIALDAWFGVWCRGNWRSARSDYVTAAIRKVHDDWVLDHLSLENRDGKVELQAWVKNDSSTRRVARFHFYISDGAQLGTPTHLASRSTPVHAQSMVQINLASQGEVRNAKLYVFEADTAVTRPLIRGIALPGRSPNS